MLLTSLLCLTLGGAPKPAPVPELDAPVHALVRAWAAKDVQGVLRLFDARQLLLMGADVAEVCTTRACAEKLLKDNFSLFDTATAEAPTALHVEGDGAFATAWFDAPFATVTGGTRRTFTLRFATAWKKEGGTWKLLQSLHTHTTVGKSAGQLARDNVLK